MIISRINLLLATALLVSCSTATTIQPTYRQETIPNIGVITVAEIGNSLVSKKDQYVYPGIELKNKVSAHNWAGYEIAIPPQVLHTGKRDSEYTYHSGTAKWDSLTGVWDYPGGLKISLDGSKTLIYLESQDFEKPPEQLPEYVHTEILVHGKQGFTQEFIYNGKSGDEALFTYRELAGDIMRSPFTQDVTYSLKEGNIIGFKGCRIEIIDLSNTNITYKVLSNFSQQ